MKAFFNKWLRHFEKAESGFTLVEMLVVVAIIIALAAVIIPSVAGFANKGDDGGTAAERDNVQTGIDLYMADNGLSTVTAHNALADTSTNDFSTATGIVDLSPYLRMDSTTYFYCWDSAGLITAQDDVATADCARTN